MRARTRPRNRTRIASLVVGLATVSLGVLPAQIASAATLTVTTCANSGTGSLPVVVAGASAGDTITFASGLSCPPASPITLTSTIQISQSLTITGPGASRMAVSGNHTVTPVLNVTSGGVRISGITIEDGGPFSEEGGGIGNSGTLTLTDDTVSGNSADNGAGIANAFGGTLTLTDDTVSGNSGLVQGGGIFNHSATLTVTDSTISGNSGGGISSNGTMTLTDSTVSGNSGGGIDSLTSVSVGGSIVADNTGANCGGTIISVGYNLTNDTTGASCGFTRPTDVVNANPLLGPLANNGGPTQTMLPASTSPAVGVIPNPSTLNSVSVCPRTDQRGVASVGKCTIGAVEGGFLITTTSLPNATPGTAYSPVTLTSQDAGTSASPHVTTLKWKKVSLPKGLKLSKTGELSGTPSNKLTAGTSSVKVQVTETVTTLNGKKKVKTKTTVQATIPLTIT